MAELNWYSLCMVCGSTSGMYTAVFLFLSLLDIALLHDMNSALSLLRTRLIALWRLLLRIVNLKFIRAAFTGLVRRLALWAVRIRSKLLHRRRFDKPPDKCIGSTTDDDKTAQRDGPAYAVVRNGEVVSWSGMAPSFYPASPDGIPSTSAPSRSGRPETRNSPRNWGSETNLVAGSTWELPFNPVDPSSRPTSPLRTPRHQFSISLPDLNDMAQHRIDHDNVSLYHRRSPPPGIGMELATAIDDRSLRISDHSEAHAPFPVPVETGNSFPSEQPTYSPLCPSPPDAIQVEAIFPVEVSPLAELSQASPRIPGEPCDTLIPAPISPASSDSQNSCSEVIPDIALGRPISRNLETEAHIIRCTIPEDTRRYSRRTKM